MPENREPEDAGDDSIFPPMDLVEQFEIEEYERLTKEVDPDESTS